MAYDLDLTRDYQPPEDLYVRVNVLQDIGQCVPPLRLASPVPQAARGRCAAPGREREEKERAPHRTTTHRCATAPRRVGAELSTPAHRFIGPESGQPLELKRGDHTLLRRGDIEHLIRQGLLEHSR